MMKHSKWLSIAASLFLSICLMAPCTVQAASSRQEKSHKSLVKKSVEHKAAKTAPVAGKSKKHKALEKKTSGKLADRKKGKKAGRDEKMADARKQGKAKRSKELAGAGKKTAGGEKQGGDRAIWLKRAQNSEALSGIASWYGKDWQNKKTASGLKYDMHTFTAAHRTLPMGTVVRVTEKRNGKSVMVCVTDRGPFIRGRVIDVSYAAAKQLGLHKRGIGKVDLEVVSDEKGTPLKADQAYYVKYATRGNASKAGPFHAFADAAAMHEALRQAHPEAEVVLEKTGRHEK